MGHDSKAREIVAELMSQGHGDSTIAQMLLRCGVRRHDSAAYTRHNVRRMMQDIRTEGGAEVLDKIQSIETSDDKMVATGICQARSLEALLDLLDVDLDTWRVSKWIGNQWGKGDMWQIKAWFERKPVEETTIDALVARLEEIGPFNPTTFRSREEATSGRALEISIADPHFGLRAFAGPSVDDYDFNIAKQLYTRSIELLLDRAEPYGPFDEIIFVTGNDFMHADNVFHTTTQGTGQPEMDSWHQTFLLAEELLIETVAGLAERAKVEVIMVPGNHARQSEFALGRILQAYFHNDERVSVDAGPEPYKFHTYGFNLIGYDHGHSIKPLRLASLMANECPTEWAESINREWHCADQHRESAVFSEFGVQIKFLPSMAVQNEWHKIKGFSWAHRCSLGFVYDFENGLICTPQVNAGEVY